MFRSSLTTNQILSNLLSLPPLQYHLHTHKTTIQYTPSTSPPMSLFSLPSIPLHSPSPSPHCVASIGGSQTLFTSHSLLFNPHVKLKPHIKLKRQFKPIIHCSSSSTSPTTASPSFRAKAPHEITVLVTGATGYIGRVVVRELVRRGHKVIAVAREKSGIKGRDGKENTMRSLAGATICFSDVTDSDTLTRDLASLEGIDHIDAAVCCLASRNGGIKDSWKIDYEATKNTMISARQRGGNHFVLLSAICVQKPLLEFQRAKLKLEAELQSTAESDPSFSYSIVRPTAFFKSLGGQVETVKTGKPYVMFGDGKLCACKPISEEDLASFIADCITDSQKINKILPIGGPGKALTPKEQGELLFRLLNQEPKFFKVPIEIMDFVIGIFDILAKIFPSLEDAAEFGKIGRYYAAESMLVYENGEYSDEKTPSYGKDTLEEFFQKVIREGMAGQELGEQTIF